MSALKWSTGSIFFLHYGIEADWELEETSVRSPIMPETRLFARGVWDSLVDIAGVPLTLPVTITLTIIPTGLTPPQMFVVMQLTADSSLYTVDSTKFSADQTLTSISV
jgi:hypothetical protein